jgi:selenocysteine-specific translation elongation factor
LIAVDHCFQIKGKGTILTGTILSGVLKINQDIEIPSISEKKKVKTIQMFKKPVESAQKGDRIGFSVTQLDSSKFERFNYFIHEIGVMYVILVKFQRYPSLLQEWRRSDTLREKLKINQNFTV